MAKQKKSNTWVVIGSVALLAVVLYFVYSYSGLIKTTTFTGRGATIATRLDCRRTADNIIEARLSVDGSGNPAALTKGSGLQEEYIVWNTSQSSGTITPATSATDVDGLAQSTFIPAPGITTPAITASFSGDRIQVNSQGNTVVVEYGPSSCDVPFVN